MEKPLAATLAEADALIAAAAARGVQLQVGHIERYNRALRAAEPYLDGPRYIESQRLAPFQPRGTDVAVVLDLMIHDLDLVLHLTGGAEATEVRASGLSVLSLPSRHRERAGRVRQRGGGAGHRLAGSRGSGCAGSGCSSPTATSRSTSPPAAASSCGSASDWRPGTGTAALGRGRADRARGARGRCARAGAAELRARGAGRARGRGRAARRGARRSRSRSGWPTPCARPPLAVARGRMIARRRPSHLRLRRRALGRPPRRRRGARPARALPGRHRSRRSADPAWPQAGATIRYPHGRPRRLRLGGGRRPSCGAHLRLLRALRAGLPRRPLRPRHPDRLSRLPPPGGRGGARRRAPRSCTTSRPSSGPGGRGGRGGSRPRWTGSRSCCRSSSRSSADSGSGATTSATRWWTGRPAPTRGEAARASSAFRADSRVLGIFPGSRAQEIRRLWAPFRDAARPAAATKAAATACWSPGRAGGEYPDPGPARRSCAATPTPVFAAADAALAKSGTTTLEAALADTPDGGRVQGAPADLAHVPAAPDGASG